MNMNVGSLTAAALKITANPFLAKFFPVPRQAHAAMGSAPQFAGKFFGTSRGRDGEEEVRPRGIYL